MGFKAGNGKALGMLVGVLLISIAGLVTNLSDTQSFITGFDVKTSTSQVVIQSYVSIARSDNLTDGINFGTIVSLPAWQQNATADYNYNTSAATKDLTGYDISISNDSNVAVDFCVKGTNLATGGGSIIGIGNYTYSNSTTNSLTEPPTYGISLSADYNTTAINIGVGSSVYYRFWLSITPGQAPGTYTNTLYFQGVPTGTSCS